MIWFNLREIFDCLLHRANGRACRAPYEVHLPRVRDGLLLNPVAREASRRERTP